MKPLNRIALVTAVLAVCAGAAMVGSAMVGSATVVNAATAGGKCSKVGQTQKTKGVSYICKKTGSKLVWAKSTASTGSSAGTVATVPATGGTTTAPALSNTPTAECKLPVADGRGDVSIGGWPRITERSKTTGKVVATVIMVDFSDAPATMTPQAAFAKISGATATFSEVSYGQLNYEFNPQYKWYRMSKPSTQYAPLNQSFSAHRAYIAEAAALADSEVDFSSTDSIVILSNPDARGLGMAGPAFAAIRGNGITLDGKYISNGTTSAYDLNYWKSIWLNHEITHTMGLVDVYAATRENAANSYDGHRYVGEFSYMGFSSFEGNAPGLFAFERWNLGWLEDSQIVCSSAKEISQLVTPVQSAGGIKAVIVPLSRTKALVVESRRAIGIDKNIAKTGALVYIVDSSLQSGYGPVKIYPSSVSTDPRYLQAPRAVGESVTVEGITVSVTSASSAGDTVLIKRP
jgi:M6 family metalloprotease-like protein